MSDTEPDTAVIDSENQPADGIQSLDPVERLELFHLDIYLMSFYHTKAHIDSFHL